MRCPYCNYDFNPEFILEAWKMQDIFYFPCPLCGKYIRVTVGIHPKFILEKVDYGEEVLFGVAENFQGMDVKTYELVYQSAITNREDHDTK